MDDKDLNMAKENENFKQKISSVFLKFQVVLAVIVLVWLAYFTVTEVLPEKKAEKEYYSMIYNRAVEEILWHWGGDDLEVSDYKNGSVVLDTTEYYDLGYGNLRYAIYVLYYGHNQKVSDGVDLSVEPHLFVVDMFTGIIEE